MRTCSSLLFCALLAGLNLLAPPKLHADSLPTGSITAASGTASWNFNGSGQVLASFSAPGASFSFSNGTFGPLVFVISPGDTPTFDYHLVIRPASAKVSFTANGKRYAGYWDGGLLGLSADLMGKVIAPDFGVRETVIVPASLSGFGPVCPREPLGLCPSSLAIGNLDVNISGTMAVTFEPISGLGETYSGVFTPTPEPSTALLILAAPLAIWVAKRSHLKVRA